MYEVTTSSPGRFSSKAREKRPGDEVDEAKVEFGLVLDQEISIKSFIYYYFIFTLCFANLRSPLRPPCKKYSADY